MASMQHVGVHIEDESGAVTAAFADTGLDPRIVSRDCTGESILRFIDPYGDLVVNQLQLPVLMAELQQIRAATSANGAQTLMRYISDVVQGAVSAGLGVGAICLAVEGLIRSSLRVVGRMGIAAVSSADAWLYWGFEAFYLLGGSVFIA